MKMRIFSDDWQNRVCLLYTFIPPSDIIIIITSFLSLSSFFLNDWIFKNLIIIRKHLIVNKQKNEVTIFLCWWQNRWATRMGTVTCAHLRLQLQWPLLVIGFGRSLLDPVSWLSSHARRAQLSVFTQWKETTNNKKVNK